MGNSTQYRDQIVLFLLTICAFQLSLGFDKFNPANISWLFEARLDWATHYLGWAFFRDASWTFPLGSVPQYYYPIGTNIGFTDSIPLMAILCKLFSFMLPENFQYFGFWLFLSMFLNGFYALKIFKLFKFDQFTCYLLLIPILLSPVFIMRQIHPSYCAHWLLIASIYLYLSAGRDGVDAWRKIRHQMILLLLSAFITVYLSVAVFSFFVLLLFKLLIFEKAITYKKAGLFFLTAIAGLFGSWISIGLINFSKHTDIASTGFYGIYKLNLNALYNPMGRSTFLPTQPLISGYQGDSYMYLGLGLILLILGVLLFCVIKRRFFFDKTLWPLVVLCIGFTVFATTNAFSFNDRDVLTLHFLDSISKIGDIFRASGRFFWSVYYLIIFYAIFVFSRIRLKQPYKVGIAVALVFIQIADITPVFARPETKPGDYKPNWNLPLWNGIFSQFRNVVTVMPFNNDLVGFQDYQEIAFLAYKNKNNVTVGNLARYDGVAATNFTNNTVKEVIIGDLPTENLYLTNKENLKFFSSAYAQGKVSILASDGYFFVYARKKPLKNLPPFTSGDLIKLAKAKQEYLKASEFSRVDTPLPASAGEVKFNFENDLTTDVICQLKGWAFIETANNNIGDSIFIYLKSDKNLYRTTSVQSIRKDITIVYKKENLDNSGFENFNFLTGIEPGEYSVLVAVKNTKGEMYYTDTKKRVMVKSVN